MQFITQPFGEVRLGEFLLNHLTDPQWTTFRAAIAFVKRSGRQHIRHALREFSAKADVRLSAGIDMYGTSKEGLNDLLEATLSQRLGSGSKPPHIEASLISES